MGNWQYTRRKDEPVTVTLSDGETITLEQGETFEADSACRMLEFVNKTNESIAEETSGAIERLNEAARDEGCLNPDGTVEPDPGTGSESTPEEDAPPPEEGDSAGRQGAPEMETEAEVSEPDTEPESPPPEEESQGPQDGERDRENGGEDAHEPSGGGDPVHLFRGTLFLVETDLECQTAALPLTFTRRYQSRRRYFGPFGWNWDHNHNIYLRELDTGDIARWNGRLHEDVFTWAGDHFEPPRGVFEVLDTKAGNPHSYVITGEGGVEWHFERPDGWTEAEKIPLVRMRDRHGNMLAYSYNTDNRLAEIRDDDDRFFHLHYGDCGLLEGVSDHSGRRIHYDHDTDVEHLVCVRKPPTSDHPDGTQTSYYYDRVYLPLELRHNILRIEDGDGRVYLENSYEHDPSTWAYGRVVEQRRGDHRYQYRYTPLQWVPPKEEFVNIPSTRVEVMNPDFGVETHTFNYRGDLLDFRYRLAKDGSYRVVIYQFEYDEQGNRSRIIYPDGSEELRTFDASSDDPRMRGKLLRKELRARDGFPAPSRIVWRGTYEPQYQLQKKVIDEGLQETEFTYDFDEGPDPSATGKLRAIKRPDATLPDGTSQLAEVRVETNDRGLITAVVTPGGARREITYGASGNERGLPHRLVRDVGGVEVEATFTYDAAGNLSEEEEAGVARRFTHNALGQLEAFEPPSVDGRTERVVSHYDTDGSVVGMERPRGTYGDDVIEDAFILDTVERNVLGHVEKIVYGANTEDARAFTQCVDFRGRPELIEDPEGGTVRHEYDERGLLIRKTHEGPDGTSKTRRWIYDRVGRLQQYIEGQNNPKRLRYEYDAFGRLKKTTFPNGSVRTFGYDDDDVVVEERVEGDPGDGSTALLGKITTEYDERGRARIRTEHSFHDDPSSPTLLSTDFFYDADDNLVKRVDPRGGVVAFNYDGLGRLVSKEDAEGNIVQNEYDAPGRLTRSVHEDQEPSGTVSREWRWEYDERGRETEAIQPDGSSERTEYDTRDLPIRKIQPLGVEVQSTYGVLGELLSEHVDPSGLDIRHAWAYDDMSRPVEYTDPTGEVVQYEYDGIGRMTAARFPGGFESTRTFGVDGRLQQEQLASGVRIEYAYDAAGRLHRLQSAGGPPAIPPHEYRYDGLDRIVEATAGSETVWRAYDSLDRLVKEESAGTLMRSAFDDLAGTVDRVWPDGRRERITLDLNGFPTQIDRVNTGSLGDDTPTLGIFSPAGPAALGTADLLEAIGVELSYDARRRLSEIHWEDDGGDTLERLVYRYDERDRIRLERSHLSAEGRYHEYDKRDRLVHTAERLTLFGLSDGFSQADHNADIASAATVSPDREHTYVYNAGDDRTSHTVTGSPTVSYGYDSGHRLVSAGSETLTYHTDGPRESDDRHTYEADALGRITTIMDDAGTSVIARIDYDAFGRPSVIQEGGDTRRLHYLGEQVVQENVGGSPQRQLSRHPSFTPPLAIHTSGQTLVPLHDVRQSRIAVLDADGGLVESVRYEPFGSPTLRAPDGTERTASSVGLEPVFGGMRHLGTANLFLSTYRLMDPRHGVFLTPDPKGVLDSPARYVYARQNPVDYIDPEGDVAFLAVLGIVAAGAAIAGGLNAARQGIQIAEGSREEFSWGELGLSAGIGAVAAPIVVFAPEIAIPLAGMGVASGVSEISEGNYATGTFDLVTSLAPFGFKGTRNAVFGKGSLLNRGTPTTGLKARWGRLTGPPEGRVTHVTGREAFNKIQTSGELRPSNIGAAEGGGRGVWVSPFRTSRLSFGRRMMTGVTRGYTRDSFRGDPRPARYSIEFDVQPGEVSLPGRLKLPFFRWQRVVRTDSPINLSGRNPKFGELPVDQPEGLGFVWPFLNNGMIGENILGNQGNTSALNPQGLAVPEAEATPSPASNPPQEEAAEDKK